MFVARLSVTFDKNSSSTRLLINRLKYVRTCYNSLLDDIRNMVTTWVLLLPPATSLPFLYTLLNDLSSSTLYLLIVSQFNY